MIRERPGESEDNGEGVGGSKRNHQGQLGDRQLGGKRSRS